MAIIFNCPNCREAYRLKDDAAGKSAKCRKCGLMITAPKPVSAEEAEALALKALLEEAPAPKAAVVVEKFKFQCEFCSHEHEVERSQEGKNMRCGECGKIVRIPKVIKDKPADCARPTMADHLLPSAMLPNSKVQPKLPRWSVSRPSRKPAASTMKKRKIRAIEKFVGSSKPSTAH